MLMIPIFKLRLLLTLSALAAGLVSTARAAEVETAPDIAVTPGIGGGDVLGMGVSMFIVIGVILVLGWVYSRSRFLAGSSSDAINVVATRALGPKERLLVVEVADQQLLIGMTSTNVQTLHVFDKPVCVTETKKEAAGFADRLRTAFQEVRK